jgi:hypothetical protein
MLDHFTVHNEKVVWATTKLQQRLRKLFESWRNRNVRRLEVTWRAGVEWTRGLCYATIAAAHLVSDGVLEWTSMDGKFYFILFIFLMYFIL